MKKGALPPIFWQELEPGQAIREALTVKHPMAADLVLEQSENEAIHGMVSNPKAMNEFRRKQVDFWLKRAVALKDESLRIIRTVPDKFVQALLLKNKVMKDSDREWGDFVHITFWKEISQAADCDDQCYIDEFFQRLDSSNTFVGRYLRGTRILIIGNYCMASSG